MKDRGLTIAMVVGAIGIAMATGALAVILSSGSDDEPSVVSTSAELVEGQDWAFSNLSVVPSLDGWRFDGSVSITNTTDDRLTLLVTVDAFRGPCPGDKVAELSGRVTVGPGDTRSVDLASSDSWAKVPCLDVRVTALDRW